MKLALALAALLFNATSAAACSCVCNAPESRVSERIDGAMLLMAVPVSVAVDFDETEDRPHLKRFPNKLIDYLVIDDFDAELSRVIQVRTAFNGAICGIPVDLGQVSYLHASESRNGGLTAGLCSCVPPAHLVWDYRVNGADPLLPAVADCYGEALDDALQARCDLARPGGGSEVEARFEAYMQKIDVTALLRAWDADAEMRGD